MRHFLNALSLTPALSRWEREIRCPRQSSSPFPVVAAVAAFGSLVSIRGFNRTRRMCDPGDSL